MNSENFVKPIEIDQDTFLYINSQLDSEQQNQLIGVLKKQLKAFAWDYHKMKDIHHEYCSNHIYIHQYAHPFRNPQRRMKPTLRQVVKQYM